MIADTGKTGDRGSYLPPKGFGPVFFSFLSDGGYTKEHRSYIRDFSFSGLTPYHIKSILDLGNALAGHAWTVIEIQSTFLTYV
jgi:hypothetical protein